MQALPVIPGWSEGPDLRCAIAHRGISRFSDVQLHIGVRCCASPRNDKSLPINDPALVAVKLQAAERTALIEIADGIRRQFCLLGHGVFAKILAAAGRAIAELVGAVIVPPGALIV